jgi:hypothetical protein
VRYASSSFRALLPDSKRPRSVCLHCGDLLH